MYTGADGLSVPLAIGPGGCAAEAFSQFAHLVDSQIGADSVACVVAEPIREVDSSSPPTDS